MGRKHGMVNGNQGESSYPLALQKLKWKFCGNSSFYFFFFRPSSYWSWWSKSDVRRWSGIAVSPWLPSGKIRCPSQTEHHHLIERQEHMQINGKLLRGETLQTCFWSLLRGQWILTFNDLTHVSGQSNRTGKTTWKCRRNIPYHFHWARRWLKPTTGLK